MEKSLKRKISIILIFSIFFSSIAPYFEDAYVSAANPVELKVDLNKHMQEGIVNYTPEINTTEIKQDEVFLSWDMSTMDVGFYELKYPLEDGKEAIITVDKNITSAIVTYDVPAVSSDPNTANTFFIHTSIGASGVEKYVPYTEYINLYNNSIDVATPDPSIPGSYVVNSTIPTFKIEKGYGFSFKYDNATVHFKWDESNMFYLSINGVKPGYIYPFTLQSGTSQNNMTPSPKKEILTGLDSNQIVVTPYSNDKNVSGGSNFVPAEDVDMTVPGTLPPGSPEAKLRLEFEIPKYWNDTTKAFEPFPDDPNNSSMSVVANFGSSVSKEMQVTFDNVLSASPQPTLSNSSGVQSVSLIEKNNNKIVFEIAGLEPGLIFDETNFSVSGNIEGNEIVSKQTVMPLGSVFTFVQFDLVNIDDEYYIQVLPYENYKGNYMIKSGTPNNMEFSAQVYSDGNAPILFPTSFDSENPTIKSYQVFFSPTIDFEGGSTDGAIYSQKAKYTVDPSKLGIGIPTNFKVLDGYNLVEKETSVDGDQSYLNMTLTWNIGSISKINSLLANSPNGELVLEYNLNKSLVPNDKDAETFDVITMKITDSGNVDNQGLPILAVEYSDTENALEPIQLENLEVVIDPSTNKESYKATVDLKSNASKYGVAKEQPFIYPNIYFLNVQPVSVNGEVVYVSPSINDSITLNEKNEANILPEQNVEAKDPITTSVENGDEKDEISFKLDFMMPGKQIKKYIDEGYNYPKDKANVTLDIYISENGDYMREEFYTYSYEERLKNSVIVPYKEEYGTSFYFSDINGNKSMSVSGGQYSTPLDALRDSKVVAITDISLSPEDLYKIIYNGEDLTYEYLLDGLDKNQKYYIYMDVVVTQKDENDVLKVVLPSDVSSLVSITTNIEANVPNGSDKVPTSPNLQQEQVEDGIKIFWDEILPSSETDVIEYQVIRTTSSQMPVEYLDDRSTFDVFWTEYLSNVTKIGLETDGATLNEYNGTSFVTVDSNSFEYLNKDGEISIIDKTTTPNQIYFYYVRTVKRVEDEEVYSTWSQVSSTTSPVKPPINLRIESDRTDYDPKTEIIFSFDAPVQDLSMIGKDYSFQYQIKEEGQPWGGYVQMDSVALTKTAVPAKEEGYYHFTYKITGLKPGTSYRIRVVMTDNATGAISLPTNEAYFKTDLDQDDYDTNQDINDWMDYLNEKLLELVKKPYWVITDTSSLFEVIYRPSMFDQLLTDANGSQVNLLTSDASTIVYYIPASCLIKANNMNKGFKIDHGDMGVIIPPNSVNPDNNDAIKSISEKIKSGDLEDYFLKITINFDESYATVMGTEPISDEINVTMDIIGTNENIAVWDEELLLDALYQIDEVMTDPKTLKKVKDAYDSGYSNEEMIKVINEIIEEEKVEFTKNVKKQLKSISKKEINFEKLDNNMIIYLNNVESDTSVDGFMYKNSTWLPVEAVDFGTNQKAIYTSDLGRYIFTGKQIIIQGIEELQRSKQIVALINKYSLDDFLGNPIDLKQNATRSMVINCIARIAGAPKGADPIKWLETNHNVVVSARNMEGYITKEETISLVMDLYEIKTGTDINTIKISNYSATAGIKNIDPKYQQDIMVAFELGIYTDKNMNPKDYITVGEFLEILATLDSKVTL